MKHFFTLAIATMAIISAHAENTFVQAQKELTPIKVENVKLDARQFNMLSQKAPKAVKAEASTLDCFLGDFVHSQWCIDPDTYDDWIGSSTDMHVVDNGDGTVTLKNVLGYGNIQATYNEEDETLVAPSMQQLFESSYGNVALCAIGLNADDEVEFQEDTDIVFYVDDENRFLIENDGVAMILMDGPYAGYMLNSFYFFNQFDRVNATMSWVDYYDDLCEVGVAIDGTAEDGYVDVYGFGDVSCVAIVIDGEEASIPEGQSVFFHSSYGMFYVQPFNPATFEVGEGDVMGTYNDGTKAIELDPFIVIEASSNTVYDIYDNATIKWNVEDTPTAISTLKAEQGGRAFNLQGRVASSFEQGQVYVKEGKKFFIK